MPSETNFLAMPTAAVAARLHQLVDILANPHGAGSLQAGDLVQIAPDSADAYQGLPAIVKQTYGIKAQLIVLRPHRGGLGFEYPLALLHKIGVFRTNTSLLAWSGQIEKRCDDCRDESRETFRRAAELDLKEQRRPSQLLIRLVKEARQLTATMESRATAPKLELLTPVDRRRKKRR